MTTFRNGFIKTLLLGAICAIGVAATYPVQARTYYSVSASSDPYYHNRYGYSVAYSNGPYYSHYYRPHHYYSYSIAAAPYYYDDDYRWVCHRDYYGERVCYKRYYY